MTFNDAGAEVEGLAKGKKAILVLASNGIFSEGPWKSWDTVEPNLRQILGFIGIDDVQTARARYEHTGTLGQRNSRWQNVNRSPCIPKEKT